MEGYLGKKGHVIPSWHTRYFIFDAESRTVAYYHSASSAAHDEAVKDSLTVTSVCDIPDRPNMRQHRFDFLCFNQAKGETLLSVCCETRELKERWLDVVESVVGQTDVTQHSRFREFAKASGHSASETQAIVDEAKLAAAERSASAMLRITVVAARNLGEQDASSPVADTALQCTIVPLDIDGREMKVEKRKTRASHTHAWAAQPYLIGAASPDGLDRATVLLIKLKAAESEADFGSVHIPLKPLLQEGSPAYLRGATTLAHQLEMRKGMATVRGELHIRIEPRAPPPHEAMAAVATEMMRSLDIADRSMYLKMQRATFLGSEAMTFLRGCPAVQAALRGAGAAAAGGASADAGGGGGGGGGGGAGGAVSPRSPRDNARGVHGVSEEEALMFGNAMVRAGFFHSVPITGQPFANVYTPFFRFSAHDPAGGSSGGGGREGGASPRESSAAGRRASAEVASAGRGTSSRGSSSGAHSLPPILGMRGASSSGGRHLPLIKPSAQGRMSIKEFEVLKLLGTGAFGKVVLARHLSTGNTFAIKVLDKKSMTEGDKINTWSERTVLNKVAHPFIAHLEFAFQSPTKLFMGMEYFSGGDLHHHIHHGRPGRRGLSAERSRFYAAEVVAAIAHMHSLKVIYRDLKGENVMIDREGHIKLVDFGLAKLQASTPRAAHSLVGSPFYVAPEVLESFQTKRGYGKAVDWWSLGILIFEMLVGATPFEAGSSRQQLYWNIAHAELRLPASMDAHCADLLRGLLRRDPNLRLGSWSEVPYDIMHHPYFEAVDWDRLIAKDLAGGDGVTSLRVPWVPDAAASYVDREFAAVTRVESLLKSKVTAPSSMPDAFEQFTFMGDNVMSEHALAEQAQLAREAVEEAALADEAAAIAAAAQHDEERRRAAAAEMEMMGAAAAAEDAMAAAALGGAGGGGGTFSS